MENGGSRHPYLTSNKAADKENFLGCGQLDVDFEEDPAALQSIIQNTGITRPQRYEEQQQLAQRRLAASPSKPEIEFYQSKGGNVFFRRKVLSPLKEFNNAHDDQFGEMDNLLPLRFGSAKKQNDLFPNRKPGNTRRSHNPEMCRPVRFGSNSKKDPFAKPNQVKIMAENGGGGERQAKLNARRSANPDFFRPVRMGMGSASKKCVEPAQVQRNQDFEFPAPHRQSISERKPRSRLPQPKDEDRSIARKSLYFGQVGGKSEFKMPVVPDLGKGEGLGLPLHPLTKLSRESIRFLPRESLTWLSQLPRDSATFSELEKLMGEQDKHLVNEDDTFSFEALESRLKTPLRAVRVPKSTVQEPEDNREEQDEEVHQSEEDAEDSFECLEARLKTPVRITTTHRFRDDSEQDTSPNRTPIKETTLNEDSAWVSAELANLPGNPILATPTIKSSSTSNLTAENDEAQIPVHRAASEEDVRRVGQMSEMVDVQQFQQIIQDLARYREEQDNLERQQTELFDKIKQRKQAFKELWGVSPMSVNKIRTVLPPKPPPASHTENTSNLTSTSGETGSEGMNECGEKNEKEGDEMEVERRVRFNSGNNKSKLMTPDSCTQDRDSSGAVSANSSFNAQSFASLKSSFAFLQTPAGRDKKSQGATENHYVEEDQEISIKGGINLGVSTPAALKSLSARVKEEFAKLYADQSDEEEKTEELSVDIMKKLSF